MSVNCLVVVHKVVLTTRVRMRVHVMTDSYSMSGIRKRVGLEVGFNFL